MDNHYIENTVMNDAESQTLCILSRRYEYFDNTVLKKDFFFDKRYQRMFEIMKDSYERFSRMNTDYMKDCKGFDYGLFVTWQETHIHDDKVTYERLEREVIDSHKRRMILRNADMLKFNEMDIYQFGERTDRILRSDNNDSSLIRLDDEYIKSFFTRLKEVNADDE